MRLLWLIAGLAALAVGFIGIVLPLVPTVPLVLLATFCFARSSERLHQWLLAHKTFGPAIEDWSSNGAIAPTAKKLATVSIVVVFAVSVVLALPLHVILIQLVVLSGVLIFIWSRPDA